MSRTNFDSTIRVSPRMQGFAVGEKRHSEADSWPDRGPSRPRLPCTGTRTAERTTLIVRCRSHLSPLKSAHVHLGDGEYWQPNDEKQNNHEAIVYALWARSRLRPTSIDDNAQPSHLPHDARRPIIPRAHSRPEKCSRRW